MKNQTKTSPTLFCQLYSAEAYVYASGTKATKASSAVHEVKETKQKKLQISFFPILGDYLGQKEQCRIS